MVSCLEISSYIAVHCKIEYNSHKMQLQRVIWQSPILNKANFKKIKAHKEFAMLEF